MIILCGRRRIISDHYGWQIQIERIHGEKSKTPGVKEWVEDRPAWPASLSQAFRMVYERELKDSPDITIAELPNALQAAADTVQGYFDAAADLGQKHTKEK